MDDLSLTFAALADPTRRAILLQLAHGEMTVSELAKPFHLALPTVSKHLKVLQRAGLVSQSRQAQWRPCRLEAAPLKDVAVWAEQFRAGWERRFEKLDSLLVDLQKGHSKMETRSSKPGSAKVSLPSDREIVIERAFHAPASLVFEAWTKPEYLRAWLVCEQVAMPVCEVDFRVGGRFRRVLNDGANGMVFAFSGEYTEIVRPQRIVYTEVYEAFPQAEMRVTLTFEETDGVTNFAQRIVHSSREGRDAQLRSGMETGLDATFERIDRVLATLPGKAA